MKTHTVTILCATFALMLATVLASGTAAVAEPSAPEYAAQKVVYHNNGRGKDSASYFKGLLKNLSNHVKAVGEERLEIRVVNHGDGLGLFQMANSESGLAEQIGALRAKGVRFLICRNTLDERKIDWHTLYGVTEGDIVPSGIAELARLQQQGFIYVHP